MQCTSGTRDDASVSVSTSRSPSLFESRPFHENEEAEMQSWNSVEKGGISRIHVCLCTAGRDFYKILGVDK